MLSSSANFAHIATEDTDEEVMMPSMVAGTRRTGLPTAAKVAVGLASALGMSALLAGAAHVTLWQAAELSQTSSVTVRQLLASDELRDVTTDNLLALHGDMLASSGREHVREQVARGFNRVDVALEQVEPDAHRQLSEIELNGEQKESAMRVLRKFGDARMVGLSRAISAAIDENARESGDDLALERRLSEKISAKIADVAKLSAEMFPNKPVDISMAGAAPALDNWHPQLQVDFGHEAHASSMRRLAVLDGISGGVNAHAQTLFESLQGELGEKMPHAPARMLSMFGPSPQTQQGGEQSFMDCIKSAVPDPTKCAKCMADHMSDVVSMVMKFMQGAAPH